MHTKANDMIGVTFNTMDDVLKSIDEGASWVRLILKSRSLREVIDIHQEIKNYNSGVKISIDLPGEKPHFGSFNEIKLSKGDIYIIDFTNSNEDAYIPVNRLKAYKHLLIEGQIMSIADDSIRLKVLNLDNNKVIVEAQNDGFLTRGRSINIKHENFNFASICNDDIKALYQLQSLIAVDSIIISNVINTNSINTVKEVLSGQTEIISKIESKTGIENLHSIDEASDSMMLGRGDLFQLSSNFLEFYTAQEDYINYCNCNNSNFSIASGILQQYSNGRNKTISGINDLNYLLERGVNSLMLGGEPYQYRAVRLLQKTMHD